MSQQEPRWIGVSDVLWVHAKQIDAHGGASGVREMGRLEASLDRPRNLFLYADADLFRLAACYAHGIAAGHPFIDGNKRTSLVVCLTFLHANGITIEASEDALYDTWMGLAEGTIAEAELSRWLARHARRNQ